LTQNNQVELTNVPANSNYTVAYVAANEYPFRPKVISSVITDSDIIGAFRVALLSGLLLVALVLQ